MVNRFPPYCPSACLHVILHCVRLLRHLSTSTWSTGTSRRRPTGTTESFRTLPVLSDGNDAISRGCTHPASHCCMERHPCRTRRRLRSWHLFRTNGQPPISARRRSYGRRPYFPNTASIHCSVSPLPCRRCRHNCGGTVLLFSHVFGASRHSLARRLGRNENFRSGVRISHRSTSPLCADVARSCLIPHDDLETEYPRLPCVGSFVQLRGYFSRVLASGVFAVEVDDLNYTCPFGSVPFQSSDASD